jgi:hypothetical protein
MKSPDRGWSLSGRIAIGLWALATLLALFLGYRLLFSALPDSDHETYPAMKTSAVAVAPDGHAYQYVAAPNLGWDAAHRAAARRSWRGHQGYLATIETAQEYRFITDKLFAGPPPDVTYLGGRQTAPGEWRWVTGPSAAIDGGKGRLFWRGDERGAAQDGAYANWMATAFQHGGKWDMNKVCCLTLFSYGLPQFSTSLGDGDPEEGVSGYLVEFGE